LINCCDDNYKLGEVSAVIIGETMLGKRSRSKELEYRIVAVNKAGDGEPSNTVMVVL
jgi:hypothetical protein